MRYSRYAMHVALILCLLSSGSASATIIQGPLAEYAYADLKLVMTFPQERGASACFLAKDKHIYWAFLGNDIGPNFGRIRGIDKDTVRMLAVDTTRRGGGLQQDVEVVFKVDKGVAREFQDSCRNPPPHVMQEDTKQKARILKALPRVKPGATEDQIFEMMGQPSFGERRQDEHVIGYYLHRKTFGKQSAGDRYVFFVFRYDKDTIWVLNRIERNLESVAPGLK